MILDENIQTKDPPIKLTDIEIFTKIWTSPRLVFKYLNDTQYDKYVNVLLLLVGITNAIGWVSTKNMGDKFSLIAVLAITIIIGGILWWIFYNIYAALLNWTGKWLHGQGDTISLLRMLSYAIFPSIISLVLLVPQIVVFGNKIFQSNIDIYGSGVTSTVAYYFSAIFNLCLKLYTMVFLVIGISEVQNISIGKAIVNMILPILILVSPFLIIALATFLLT